MRQKARSNGNRKIKSETIHPTFADGLKKGKIMKENKKEFRKKEVR